VLPAQGRRKLGPGPTQSTQAGRFRQTSESAYKDCRPGLKEGDPTPRISLPPRRKRFPTAFEGVVNPFDRTPYAKAGRERQARRVLLQEQLTDARQDGWPKGQPP